MDKRSIKNKQFAIFTLLIAFVFVLCFGVYEKISNKESVVAFSSESEKLFTKSTIGSSSYGNWTFKTEFVDSNASGLFDISNTGDSAAFNPISNSLTPLGISLSFGANDSSSCYSVPADDMEIRIPLFMFNYSGDYYFNSESDPYVNDIIISNSEGGTNIGKFEFGTSIYNYELLKDYTSDEYADMFKFYWTVDGTDLVIRNLRTISSCDTFDSIDFSFSYLPSTIGTDSKVNNISAKFGDDSAQTVSSLKTSRTSSLTFSEHESTHNNPLNYAKYGYWNFDWGDNDYEDEEDVIFVEYTTKGKIVSTDDYNLNVSYDTNGTLVSFSSDGSEYVSCDSDCFLNDYASTSKTLPSEENYEYHFVVMYNIDDLYEMDIKVSADNGKSYFKEDSFVGNSDGDKQFEQSSTSDSDITTPQYPEGDSNAININLIDDTSSTGAINKLKGADSVNYEWSLEPVAASINKDTNGKTVKAFNNYNNTDSGSINYTIDLATSGLYYDSSYSVIVNKIQLSSSNYVISTMQLIDDIEYDYQESGKNYVLSEVTDYDNYSDKNVYAKINNNSWELIGSYINTSDGISFTSSYSGVSFDSDTNTITLPSNVTDVKVSYTGSRAAVYIGFKYTTKIVGDSKLVSAINSITSAGNDFVIKAVGNIALNDTICSDSIKGTILTEFKSNSSLDIASSKVKDGTTDVVTYDIDYHDSMNIGSLSSTEASKYFTSQDKGDFYILIPKGVNYDSLIVYDASGNVLSNSNYTVTNSENYYDDRRMVKVSVKKSGNNTVSGSNLVSGFKVRMIINYTKSDNIKYKNNLYLDVAYLGTDLGTGKTSFDDYSSSSFTSSGAKDLFSDNVTLTGDYNTLLFKSNVVTLTQAVVLSGSLSSNVKGSTDDSYSNSAIVNEGASYRYKLEYVFGDSYEEISNVKIFDVLENNDSTFNGVVSDVDTSYLDDNGISYTVYYSVKEEIDLTDVMYTDLNDSTIWTDVIPTDKSSIKAVAVKINSKMYGSDSINPLVYIDMVAPVSNGTSLVAKNSGTMMYNDGDSDKTINSGNTTVNLVDNTLDLGINVLDSFDGNVINDGESIPGSYGYLYKITNTDSVSYDNVSLSINIPNIVTINEDEIKALVNDSETALATYTISGDKISVNINNISDSGFEIWIPVSIDVSKVTNETTSISSSAVIDSINDISFNNDSVIVNNAISIPNISYGKYVDTEDTAIYSEASTPVLITPGETYSYMIEIKNTSSTSANNIKVVDNVPNGVTVYSISNGGVYNSSDRTITWNISELKSLEIKSLEYSVTVSNDIPLKTEYSSKGHVTLANPLDTSYYIVDDDTNTVNVIYQVASDVKVSNKLVGALADDTKEFTYNVELSGSSSDAGDYNIVDGDGKTLKTITLDSDGKGSTSLKLKGDESFAIKLLPSGIDYVITQTIEDGYVTTVNSETTNEIIGTTNEERLVSYTFDNSYNVSTTVNINGYISYSNGISEGQFSLVLTDMDDNIIETVSNDASGKVSFSELKFFNESGLKQYKIYEISGSESQILYDSNIYTISINLVDDGKGNLNSNIKYYDKNDEVADTLRFINTYVPTGFVIGNNNVSDYVDSNKKFKYKLEVSNSISGIYNVFDSSNAIIGNVTVDSDGVGEYEFTLGNDDQVIVSDLPIGTKYVLYQYNEDYYSSTINGGSYSVDKDNDAVVSSGSIDAGTSKVIYTNSYSTTATYKPSVSVSYTDSTLEANLFNFLLTDISDGSTNGFSEVATNDETGKLIFNEIKYSKPGEYKYVITQIKGDDNHTIYDNGKCYLTLLLSDNGDGTMSYTYTYSFDNEAKSFVNKYSEEEVNNSIEDNEEEAQIIDDSNKYLINPNTGVFGKILIFVGIAIITSLLIYFARKNIKLKKFES